jgi:hypothetical protein
MTCQGKVVTWQDCLRFDQPVGAFFKLCFFLWVVLQVVGLIGLAIDLGWYCLRTTWWVVELLDSGQVFRLKHWYALAVGARNRRFPGAKDQYSGRVVGGDLWRR